MARTVSKASKIQAQAFRDALTDAVLEIANKLNLSENDKIVKLKDLNFGRSARDRELVSNLKINDIASKGQPNEKATKKLKDFSF